MTGQPTPLTPEELDQIEARATAATPGPWGLYESGGLIQIAADLEKTGYGYRARRGIARLDEEPLDNEPTHREWTAEEDWAQVQADGLFIAHAPEDVRALIAAVRRLQAQRKYLLDQLAKRDAETGRADEAVRGFLAAGEDAVAEQESAACAACRTPFDPADTRHDGHARHGLTDHCRRCVDRCHEASDAFHVCAVCRTAEATR